MTAPQVPVPALPPNLPRGRYRHYKGNDYEVIATATHSETGEALVLYRALYGAHALWVRPLQMFFETVLLSDGSSAARFTYLGPDQQEKLGPERWLAARTFMQSLARPLERALYNWRFEGGGAEAVLVALTPYQNPDGGFGNGLEPDLQMAASSVLATARALGHLREIGATADVPLVQAALAWLRAAWDPALERWPLIPGDTDSAPHAPWWSYGPDHDEQFGGYLINPRLEILGYLWDWGAGQDRAWLDDMSERAVAWLESIARPLTKNEVICCTSFVATAGAPEELRSRVATAVVRLLPISVATSPAQWKEYTLQPVEVATRPDSPFEPSLAAVLDANLDHLIAAQQAEGAWWPAWSWFGNYDEFWPSAEQAWKGVLTLEALQTLTAWGRIAL